MFVFNLNETDAFFVVVNFFSVSLCCFVAAHEKSFCLFCILLVSQTPGFVKRVGLIHYNNEQMSVSFHCTEDKCFESFTVTKCGNNFTKNTVIAIKTKTG